MRECNTNKNTGNGFRLSTNANALSGCIADNNSSDGFYISGSNCLMRDSSATNNSSAGIGGTGATNLELCNNIANANGTDLIDVSDSSLCTAIATVQTTIDQDFDGTFTAIAAINLNCDLTGVYTAIDKIQTTVDTTYTTVVDVQNTVNSIDTKVDTLQTSIDQDFDGTFTAIAAINLNCDLTGVYTAIDKVQTTVDQDFEGTFTAIAGVQTSIDNCCTCDYFITQADIPYTINQPGVYCVSEDINYTGGTAITINASNHST